MFEIRREHDTELIDRISNEQEVRPFICYHNDAIDWLPVIKGCAVLSNGVDAIGIFEQSRYDHPIYQKFKPPLRVWQTHTLFGKTCRGARALEAGRAMLDFMVPEYADVIWGATPIKNPQARWFNRKLGARVFGHDDYEVEGPVELFAYTKE